MTQQELNSLTSGFQQHQNTLAKDSATEKQQQLEQQRIQLQQQQLHHQAIEQRIMVGGLIVLTALVFVIAIYIIHKIRHDNRKLRAK